MAETFVNLVTGATLPDRGVVTTFGRPTSSIDDSAEWLAVVDRFGIVSERAVLLDALSVIQNLSIPFTLEIEPPPDDVRERAAALAREVGLEEHDWSRPVADLDAAGRLRLRAGRALALDPGVLLLEHASAGLPGILATTIGTQIRQIASRRACALDCADRGRGLCSSRRRARADARSGQRPAHRAPRWIAATAVWSVSRLNTRRPYRRKLFRHS